MLILFILFESAARFTRDYKLVDYEEGIKAFSETTNTLVHHKKMVINNIIPAFIV